MSTVADRDAILERFGLFQGGTGGLDSWLSPQAPDEVIDSLTDIEAHPLTKARFNQLLTLAHEAPITDALFYYYWLHVPDKHPYDVRSIPCYDDEWMECDRIYSLDHLYWGLYRFYVDALLFFGNVRTAFQRLRKLSGEEILLFFERERIAPIDLSQRGAPLRPDKIAKDNRYLISEMACKSYDEGYGPGGEISTVLTGLYSDHKSQDGGRITTGQLLTGAYNRGEYKDRQMQLDLSADDFLEETIENEDDLRDKIARVSREFSKSRKIALRNTKMYLSMVGDLDVYVATSMRKREDFRSMADFCEEVFEGPELTQFELRFFDPTLSAAEHHEDKGLLECLMVKCAKVLVLQAGEKDSYGKDAEAAMALSLGKPVIIHADEEFRSGFFQDVHPLSRLIDFRNGVAVGAMVTTTTKQVVELLHRILTNNMQYKLEQNNPGYLVLKEEITQSIVRLQTSDKFLRETFWNHYHNGDR